MGDFGNDYVLKFKHL